MPKRGIFQILRDGTIDGLDGSKTASIDVATEAALEGSYRPPMSGGRKPTIWIVEDEPEICCLFVDVLIVFNGYLLSCVDSADKVDAQPGDIVFLDMRGTKAAKLNSNGARVITMSGDESLHPEVSKPFRFSEIRELIREALAPGQTTSPGRRSA